jgi:hypothetical protein
VQGQSEFADEQLVGKYTFEKENGTNSIIGRSFLNNTETGEQLNEMDIKIEFETGSETKGKYLSGKSTHSMTKQFSFDFDGLPPLGHVRISQGPFGKSQSYSFLSVEANTFIWTIYGDKDKAQKQLILIGKRMEINPEKTFMQKYGTYIMIGVMMMLQMYMKSRTAFAQPRRLPPSSSASSASSVAAAAQSLAPVTLANKNK